MRFCVGEYVIAIWSRSFYNVSKYFWIFLFNNFYLIYQRAINILFHSVCYKIIGFKTSIENNCRCNINTRCLFTGTQHVCEYTDYSLYSRFVSPGHCNVLTTVKCKAIPLQALIDPECSRSLRFPDFKTIGAWR
jgi:hypothetical protein